jgi:hypothetical protein
MYPFPELFVPYPDYSYSWGDYPLTQTIRTRLWCASASAALAGGYFEMQLTLTAFWTCCARLANLRQNKSRCRCGQVPAQMWLGPGVDVAPGQTRLGLGQMWLHPVWCRCGQVVPCAKSGADVTNPDVDGASLSVSSVMSKFAFDEDIVHTKCVCELPPSDGFRSRVSFESRNGMCPTNLRQAPVQIWLGPGGEVGWRRTACRRGAG